RHGRRAQGRLPAAFYHRARGVTASAPASASLRRQGCRTHLSQRGQGYRMWQIPPHRLARSAHATSPPLAQGRGTTGIDIAATADVGGLQKRKCGPPLPPSQVGGGGETKSRPSEGERPVTAIWTP